MYLYVCVCALVCVCVSVCVCVCVCLCACVCWMHSSVQSADTNHKPISGLPEQHQSRVAKYEINVMIQYIYIYNLYSAGPLDSVG